MKFRILANVPNQDHVRTWIEIGTCETLEEFNAIKENYIQSWEPTSNVLRLRELGSFELVKVSDKIFGTQPVSR